MSAPEGFTNCFKLDTRDFKDLVGLTEFAMSGIDYVPISPEELKESKIVSDDLEIHSGSMRIKGTYDVGTGQHVDVVDFVGVVRDKEAVNDMRRLIIASEDGWDDEVDMDSGEIVIEESKLTSKDNVTVLGLEAKKRIFGALMAIVEDAI